MCFGFLDAIEVQDTLRHRPKRLREVVIEIADVVKRQIAGVVRAVPACLFLTAGKDSLDAACVCKGSCRPFGAPCPNGCSPFRSPTGVLVMRREWPELPDWPINRPISGPRLRMQLKRVVRKFSRKLGSFTRAQRTP